MWPILDNRKVWLRLAGYWVRVWSENRVDQKLMVGHGVPMENRHLMCIHHYLLHFQTDPYKFAFFGSLYVSIYIVNPG